MGVVEANKRSPSCIYLVINCQAEALNCCIMHSSSYLTPEHRPRTKPSELRQQRKGWKNMKFHKLTHSLAAHFSISHSIPSAGGEKSWENDDASRITTANNRTPQNGTKTSHLPSGVQKNTCLAVKKFLFLFRFSLAFKWHLRVATRAGGEMIKNVDFSEWNSFLQSAKLFRHKKWASSCIVGGFN